MATNLERVGGGVSQTWLSFRFELLKHLKRLRLLILAGVGIVVPLLFLIYYYKGHPVAASDFASASLMLMNVLILISAAMFAGDAICGEFEKKTSLLLFPTPQKRSSIFAGKYLGRIDGNHPGGFTLLLGADTADRTAIWLGKHTGRAREILCSGLGLLRRRGKHRILRQQHSETFHVCHHCRSAGPLDGTADHSHDPDGATEP